MKKFLFVTFSFFSIVFSANAESVMGVLCEKVVTGADGDYLLKCPITSQLEVFKNQDANSVFASVINQGIQLADLLAETDFLYVNVVPNSCAPDVPGHRFLIRADGEYYAYEACI